MGKWRRTCQGFPAGGLQIVWAGSVSTGDAKPAELVMMCGWSKTTFNSNVALKRYATNRVNPH
jgi:hypothetical protein